MRSNPNYKQSLKFQLVNAAQSIQFASAYEQSSTNHKNESIIDEAVKKLTKGIIESTTRKSILKFLHDFLQFPPESYPSNISKNVIFDRSSGVAREGAMGA